jgi:hypothetical protein
LSDSLSSNRITLHGTWDFTFVCDKSFPCWYFADLIFIMNLNAYSLHQLHPSKFRDCQTGGWKYKLVTSSIT